MALDKFSISITITLILVFAGKNLICPNVLFRLAKLTYGMGVRRNLFREGKHFRGTQLKLMARGLTRVLRTKIEQLNVSIF